MICPKCNVEFPDGACCAGCGFCAPEKSTKEIKQEEVIERDVMGSNYGPSPYTSTYIPTTEAPIPIIENTVAVQPEMEMIGVKQPPEDVTCEDAMVALDQSADLMVEAHCTPSKDKEDCKIKGMTILNDYAENKITEEEMQKRMKELIE